MTNFVVIMTTFTSLPFKTTPSQYVGRIMNMWLSHWWWVMAIPFLVCCILAVQRWEWLVVGLMLLTLVYPFVLAVVFYKYALNPETSKRIQWMQVEVGTKYIQLKYLDCQQSDYKDDESVVFHEISSEVVNFDNIARVSDSGKGLLIRFYGDGYRHIYLPEESFADNQTANNDNKYAVVARFKEYGIKFA